MNRLIELPPEQQTSEQKKVFEQLVAGRGRLRGPYKIWIHAPTVASGMEHIGTYLNKKGSLSEREVEIGILVIAQHWDADYVRQAHIKMGRQVGLSQDIIDAVLAGRDPKLSDPHERAVHRLAADASAQSQQPGAVPTFAVDASWPKVPPQWKLGDTSSIAIDAQDNVYVLHRPLTLKSEDAAKAAPPVMVFDAAGNFVKSWGGAGPGFDWPEREHGIHIDHKGFAWIGGNNCPASGLAGRKPVPDDAPLKVSLEGKFILRVG